MSRSTKLSLPAIVKRRTSGGRLPTRSGRTAIRLRHWLASGAVLTLFAACGGGDGDDSGAGVKLGVECEKYHGSGGCCLEVAGHLQHAKDSCEQSKQAVVDGLKSGGKASDFEAACKAGNDAAKLAGKCLPKLGPECEKYYGSGGCCLKLADTDQTAIEACNKAKEAIRKALGSGEDPAKDEAKCKESLNFYDHVCKTSGDGGTSNDAGGDAGNDAGTDGSTVTLGPKCTEYFAKCCEPTIGATQCAQEKAKLESALQGGVADPAEEEKTCADLISDAKIGGAC